MMFSKIAVMYGHALGLRDEIEERFFYRSFRSSIRIDFIEALNSNGERLQLIVIAHVHFVG